MLEVGAMKTLWCCVRISCTALQAGKKHVSRNIQRFFAETQNAYAQVDEQHETYFRMLSPDEQESRKIILSLITSGFSGGQSVPHGGDTRPATAGKPSNAVHSASKGTGRSAETKTIALASDAHLKLLPGYEPLVRLLTNQWVSWCCACPVEFPPHHTAGYEGRFVRI